MQLHEPGKAPKGMHLPVFPPPASNMPSPLQCIVYLGAGAKGVQDDCNCTSQGELLGDA